MKTSRPGLLFLLLVTGCYQTLPFDDESFTLEGGPREVSVGSVSVAEARLHGDGEMPVPAFEFEGTPSSISDDGQWLVTCRWTSSAFLDYTATLYNLRSGSQSSFIIDATLFSCPVISGDGSSLTYITSMNREANLWLVDRATLAHRLLASGEFGFAPVISDDASRVVFVACTRPRVGTGVEGCDPRVHRLDVESGAVEVLAVPHDEYLLGLGVTMSGDGDHLLYTLRPTPDEYVGVVVGADDVAHPAEILTGLANRTAVSDDGQIMVGTRSAVVGLESGPTVLDLSVVTADGVFGVGPDGEPTLPVSSVALSGNGRVAVFSVLQEERLEVYRLRLEDGRTELVTDCTDGWSALVSDSGRTIAVGVFHCADDPSFEPHFRTRVYQMD